MDQQHFSCRTSPSIAELLLLYSAVERRKVFLQAVGRCFFWSTIFSLSGSATLAWIHNELFSILSYILIYLSKAPKGSNYQVKLTVCHFSPEGNLSRVASVAEVVLTLESNNLKKKKHPPKNPANLKLPHVEKLKFVFPVTLKRAKD